MSFIVKGIDLPKEDEVMVITVWGDDKDGTAFISNKEPSIVVPINAIQIPKGHGRVIDGGWVKYNLENYSDLPTKYLHMDLVREAIEDAPTILEAEE